MKKDAGDIFSKYQLYSTTQFCLEDLAFWFSKVVVKAIKIPLIFPSKCFDFAVALAEKNGLNRCFMGAILGGIFGGGSGRAKSQMSPNYGKI